MRFVKPVLLLALWLVSAPLWALPDIQAWKLPNGAQVLFVQAPELPMLDLRVVFNAGSARDGDKPGLAVLTNGLLEEGAGGLSADAIAQRFASLGARFGNEALRDMALVELRSLTDPKLLEPALELATTVLTRPDFPDAAVERERSRMLVAIQHNEQEPDEISSRLLYRALYGDHPYGHVPIGTQESVGRLTAEDLRGFYQRFYVGRNAVVALVGDITREQAEKIAARVAGGLPAGEPPAVLPTPAAATRGETIRERFPSSQTHLVMGTPLVTRHDPDLFPLLVGNQILGGGGLVSLLSKEIREKRGLTYNVYADLRPMQVAGPYVFGLQTRNETAGEALKLLQQTVAEFIERGPTETELDAAKRHMTGGFPLSIDSNRELVQYLAMIGFYQLPLDWLATYTAKIDAVTAEQVRDAFRRRLRPEAMSVITVGTGG